MLGFGLLCLFMLPVLVYLFVVPKMMRDSMWEDTGLQLIAAYAFLGLALLLFWEAQNTVQLAADTGLSLKAWFRWGGLASFITSIFALVYEPRSDR